MINSEITINLLVFLVAVVGAACIGYILKNAKLRKAAKKIQKLEIELLDNHAEILRMQQELAIRQSSMAPVVHLRDSGEEAPVAHRPDNSHPVPGATRRQAK